jgi:hypothetical protein
MAASFSITILPGASPSKPAQFDPSNLVVDNNDVVHWNNTSAKPHLLWETESDGKLKPVPLGGTRWPSIQPGDQSPAWTARGASGTKIFYCCLRHEGEKGTITIR